MNYTLPILLLAALPSLAQHVSPNESKRRLDAKYGFRDVRFETDTASISGLQRAFTSGVTTFYERPTDSHTVGTTTLDHIYYGFVEGRLAEVVLRSTIQNNGFDLVKAYQAEYGEGCTVCSQGDYYWGSDKTRLSIQLNRAAGDVRVRMWSKAMEKVEDAAAKKAGKQAARDL